MSGRLGGASRRTIWLSGAMAVAGFLPVFLVGPLAVQLMQSLELGPTGIGFASSIFFGTVGLSSFRLGALADALGASRSLTIGASITAGSLLLIGFASSDLLSLSLFIAVGGLGSALVQPATNRLLLFEVDGARLGTAFGIKQSAAPLAAMLAGALAPSIATMVGWRQVFLYAAALPLFLVGVRVGRKPSRGRVRQHGGQNTGAQALDGRGTRQVLVTLALGFGLAFAASSIVLTFYVDSAVTRGAPQRWAGAMLSSASLAAIVVRVVAGAASDRRDFSGLRMSGGMLGVGAIGLLALAVGPAWLSGAAIVLSLAGTWGPNGLFWHAVVSAFPTAPGKVTGAMAPSALGGVLGPMFFGAAVDRFGYSSAWLGVSLVALAGAAVTIYGATSLEAQLNSGGRVHDE